MSFFFAVVYAALACSYAAPSNYGYAPAAAQSAYAPMPTYGGAAAATMAAMKDTAETMGAVQPAVSEIYFFQRDYQFNYNINDEMSGSMHQRTETQKDGVITGSFAYTAPDGKLMTVNYVADENGYRPEITETQGPVMKTNMASTYTMNLPDNPEQIQVSITKQEMDAIYAKNAEMEKAAAYGAYPQAAAPAYQAPAVHAAPTYAAPAAQQTYARPVAAPAQHYSAPAQQTFSAPKPAPVRY